MRNPLWLIPAVLLVPISAVAAEPDAQGKEFFEAKIRPVLVEHCYSCHSAQAAGKKKLKGGLRLDTADAMRTGGDSGPTIVPGKPAASVLVKALKGADDYSPMPPRGKLPAAVIADFEKWVSLGAPDPRTQASNQLQQTGPGIDLQKGKRHWAFQPPRKHAPPQVRNASWPRTDLDRFILAKLEEKHLTPSGPANKRTLIRRVYFDLIGLPPTPEEVEAFVNDSSPDAYAKVIDKLLASPRYGERWARHWLDVARFAGDQAHTFAVRLKTSAWRYRDWVIDALNADMPYDQFVRLQLAGDLVPESAGDRSTRLAGLGFLGLGAEYYKNSDAAQAIADELDDRVDTVTRGFLALTVSCARCHDHKFDPIPTRDYYSLAGIFNGSKLTDAALAPPDVVKRYDDAQAKVKARETKVKDWLADKGRALAEAEVPRTAQYLLAVRDKKESHAKLNSRVLRRWAKFLDPKAANRVPASLRDLLAAKPADAAKRAHDFQKQLAEAVAAKKPSQEQQQLLKAILTGRNAPLKLDPKEVEKSLPKADAKQLTAMRTELEQLKKKLPPMYPVAHVLSGGGNTLHVFLRGNPAKQGELAPKGSLQILHTASSGHPGKDYDRLDLANAIASKDNPLTARVIVNRVWAHHFGRGLVNTTSNFGKLGDRPTHPELLDWLTVRFVEHGWSLKWLHREILRSATYQQRSASNPANAEADADNLYLWRANRRRLEVEPWRDALLAVAGRLDAATGGPATNLRDPGNRRRTVYAKISRHDLNSLLRLFDFPDANVTAATRTMTTVPQQQLFVLNSEFIVTQAKAFAARVRKAATDDAKRIELAYRLAYGRAPTAGELRIGRAFLAASTTPADKLTRWEQYAQVLLAANEFLYVD